MSLIQCKDCHMVISTNSSKCIHCGYEKKSFIDKFKNIVYYVKISIITIIILSFISIVVSMQSNDGREKLAKNLNKSIDNQTDVIKKMIIQRLE